MLVSEMLDLPVLSADGERIGYVNDVRFVLDGRLEGQLAQPHLHGLIVSPRRRGSFLGYERRNTNAPALINAYLSRRHAGSVLVLWTDVTAVGPDGVRLVVSTPLYDPAL